jgi:hypothetical protein
VQKKSDFALEELDASTHPDTEEARKQVCHFHKTIASLLKSYVFMSDELINHLALTEGVNIEEVRPLLNRLRELRMKQEELISRRRERLYFYYHRCMNCRKRLMALSPEDPQWKITHGCLKAAYFQYRKIKDRLAHISHPDIPQHMEKQPERSDALDDET